MFSAWLTTWLLSVLATAGAAAFLAMTVCRLGVARHTSLLVGLLVTVGMAQYFLALGGGLTEPFAALPLSLAMYLTLGPSRSRSAGRMAAVGSLLATSTLLSLQALPGAAVLLVLGTAGAPATRRDLRTHGALLVGGLVPLVASLVWLSVSGALPAAIDAVFAYPAAYRSANLSAGSSLSTSVVAWLLLAFLYLVVAAAIGTPAALKAGSASRTAARASIGWIGLTLVFLVFQGRFIAHYAILLALPLSVLGAYGIQRLGNQMQRTSVLTRRLAFAAPLSGAVGISLLAAVVAGQMELAPVAHDHQRAEAVAAAIRGRTLADESIWVWGNKPQLYLEARRPVAGSFSYLYPLVTSGYATRNLVAETLADLMSDPPSIVIDAGSDYPGRPGFQPLLIYRPIASDGRDLDILEPLRSFIREEYVQAETVDGWVLFERRDR